PLCRIACQRSGRSPVQALYEGSNPGRNSLGRAERQEAAESNGIHPREFGKGPESFRDRKQRRDESLPFRPGIQAIDRTDASPAFDSHENRKGKTTAGSIGYSYCRGLLPGGISEPEPFYDNLQEADRAYATDLPRNRLSTGTLTRYHVRNVATLKRAN